jgi:hypothetical protein
MIILFSEMLKIFNFFQKYGFPKEIKESDKK